MIHSLRDLDLQDRRLIHLTRRECSYYINYFHAYNFRIKNQIYGRPYEEVFLSNAYIFLLLFFSCQDDAQLSEKQKAEITEEIKEMAGQFFYQLDANNTDAAMNYIDSSAAFSYVSFFNLKISRTDIASAYKVITSLKSEWRTMEIEPITTRVAYFQGNFQQAGTDSTGTVHEISGSISALVRFQDKN